MRDLAIVGAGGFGREVRTLVDHINFGQIRWNLLGFYDDAASGEVDGLPVLGSTQDLTQQSNLPSLVIAIGNTDVRCQVVTRLEVIQPDYATLIHPKAVIGDVDRVFIASGSIITAGVILTTGINLGKHVILNLNTTIGHDASVGDFCSIMPGVNLAGNVSLGKGVYIGSGANILGDISIGDFSTVGAGSVATKDIPANATAVGVPARVLKNTSPNV